jgi:signal transduction histidine kinase
VKKPRKPRRAESARNSRPSPDADSHPHQPTHPPAETDGLLDVLESHMGMMAVVEDTLSRSDLPRAAQAGANLRVAMEHYRQAHRALHPSDLNGPMIAVHYQDLFESAPEGYLVTNPAGRINIANNAAAAMLNMPRQYLTLKPMNVLIGDMDRNRFWAALHSMRHLARGEWIFQMIPRARPPMTVQATANVIQNLGGGLAGLRWILHDVSLQQDHMEHAAATREKLQSLATNIVAAEERERRRIAVQVHDRVSQPLAMTKMAIGRLRRGATPEQLRVIEELTPMLDIMIHESRTLTFELSPPMLYEIGFGAAISSLGDVLQRDHGLRVQVREDASIEPMEMRVLLYQFAHELLMNIVKHAKATAAMVTVRHEGNHSITVTVADDGSGFDAHDVARHRTSYGLFSIRTRLEQVGGFMRIESSSASGTCVTLTVPFGGGGGKFAHLTRAGIKV